MLSEHAGQCSARSGQIRHIAVSDPSMQPVDDEDTVRAQHDVERVQISVQEGAADEGLRRSPGGTPVQVGLRTGGGMAVPVRHRHPGQDDARAHRRLPTHLRPHPARHSRTGTRHHVREADCVPRPRLIGAGQVPPGDTGLRVPGLRLSHVRHRRWLRSLGGARASPPPAPRSRPLRRPRNGRPRRDRCRPPSSRRPPARRRRPGPGCAAGTWSR